MEKNRLEAFSDGVMAIILTIMVLELKAPHEASWNALQPLMGKFGAYIISFIYIGIYWNNHHHMLQLSRKVSGRVLWANLHLLFWLSLVPFATHWVGETSFGKVPVAVYGVLLLMAGISFQILEWALMCFEGDRSELARALSGGWKEKASIGIYVLGTAISFVSPTMAMLLFVLVAAIWFVPDKRMEIHHSKINRDS